MEMSTHEQEMMSTMSTMHEYNEYNASQMMSTMSTLHLHEYNASISTHDCNKEQVDIIPTSKIRCCKHFTMYIIYSVMIQLFSLLNINLMTVS